MNGTLLVLPSANDAALKRLALEQRARSGAWTASWRRCCASCPRK